MLEGVEGIPFSMIIAGCIWAVALGFAAGNYACSLVHRLPRGRLLLDKTPYCGSCGALLQVKDLFPVVSALLLRHRCRYCKAAYPTSHTWTELLVGALFVLAYLNYSFTEQFLLIVLVGIFLITLAAIEANEKMLMGKVLVCVLVFGAMHRILQDGTIYNFFEGGLYAGFVGLALTHKQTKKVGHIYVPSPLAMLMAVGGVCVGKEHLLEFLAIFAVLFIVGKIAKLPTTVPYGLAVTAVILYPGMWWAMAF